jgi:hypothetical protein
MTARALVSSDGNGTVELTTGSFESPATPPGSFAKVQFKPLTSAGNAQFAQNFTNLSTATGYYSFSSPALYRGERIQLQGNITGIDRNRTDVVTVVETVKNRPDVAVTKVTAIPSPAVTNQAVDITASLMELQKDTPAVTTCQLFVYQGAVPGSPVDQANNVYVDAGGSVTCAFSYTFTAPGTYTLQVTAAKVVPGDWDLGNNSASTQITVSSPSTVAATPAEHGDAYFTDYLYSYASSGSYQAWNSGALVQDYAGSDSSLNHWQQSHVAFNSSGCVGSTNATTWQFPVNVVVTETMDGNPIYSFTDNGVTGTSYQVPQPPGGFGSICNSGIASVTAQMGSHFANDHWQYLESYQYFDSSNNLVWIQQLAHSERYSGDVTYWSQGYQCNYWSPSPSGACSTASDYYSWNSGNETLNGTIVAVGTTWAASISTQDAANTAFSGSISVPLTGYSYNSAFPNSCSSGTDPSGNTYQSCSSSTLNFSYTSGWASQ